MAAGLVSILHKFVFQRNNVAFDVILRRTPSVCNIYDKNQSAGAASCTDFFVIWTETGVIRFFMDYLQ